MKISPRGQIAQNKGEARKASPQVTKPPLPVRCVIVIPGHDIEVPAIFQSWIYDGPEEDQNLDFPSHWKVTSPKRPGDKSGSR
jgi:hypothetical protein